MKIFGVNPANRTIDEKLNFLIEYKDKIFDEKFQYKKTIERWIIFINMHGTIDLKTEFIGSFLLQ